MIRGAWSHTTERFLFLVELNVDESPVVEGMKKGWSGREYHTAEIHGFGLGHGTYHEDNCEGTRGIVRFLLIPVFRSVLVIIESAVGSIYSHPLYLTCSSGNWEIGPVQGAICVCKRIEPVPRGLPNGPSPGILDGVTKNPSRKVEL